MFMTKELMQSLYRRESEAQVYSRLKPIKRTTASVFFAHLHLNEDVSYLDPFQSFDDFKNDLKGLFMKPLFCDFYALYHELKADLEAGLFVINLCTLSFAEAGINGWNFLEHTAMAFGYAMNSLFAATSVVVQLAMRCLMTLATGIARLWDPQVPLQQPRAAAMAP